MRAAIVQSFESPPRYGDFEEPTAGPGQFVVEVKAAGLSRLTRGQASGRHYSSGTPPFVPGFDGTGRLADGRRVYFAAPLAPFGAMAERALVEEGSFLELPAEMDDATAAAIANPGMSSSAALTVRARLLRGEAVLVLGATGTSGKLAVPIARHLGAGRVVAVGRSRTALDGVGADAVLTLDAPDAEVREALKGVDVVLDYLWGPPAERLLHADGGQGLFRSDAARPLGPDRLHRGSDPPLLRRDPPEHRLGADRKRSGERFPPGSARVDRGRVRFGTRNRQGGRPARRRRSGLGAGRRRSAGLHPLEVVSQPSVEA